ncbi:MAG: hypothetical protein ACQXXD_07340 [Thermoplasmatota archaeon]
MNIDRRLTILGVMLVVLSMTMATQYATTKVSYTYSIVHPSNADIRFIGSDNGSDGRCLRALNNGTVASVQFSFGNWSANSNKTYTAAFGIVNEETMTVNITHINVSNVTGADYMQIWLHGNRSVNAVSDASGVFVWNKGSLGYTSESCVWTLAAGNQDASNMCADGNTQLPTPWDTTKGVRYSVNDANYSINGTSDFVWVQISIDIPADADMTGAHEGTIWIHFKAS